MLLCSYWWSIHIGSKNTSFHPVMSFIKLHQSLFYVLQRKNKNLSLEWFWEMVTKWCNINSYVELFCMVYSNRSYVDVWAKCDVYGKYCSLCLKIKIKNELQWRTQNFPEGRFRQPKIQHMFSRTAWKWNKMAERGGPLNPKKNSTKNKYLVYLHLLRR